jgi:predicted nucleic acid-binding Zn ribbon protein
MRASTERKKRECRECGLALESRRKYCSDECRADARYDRRIWNALRVTAVHEAAHAIVAFHFDFTVLSIEACWAGGGQVETKPDALETPERERDFEIVRLAGPFADVDYRESTRRAVNWAWLSRFRKTKRSNIFQIPHPWSGFCNDFWRSAASTLLDHPAAWNAAAMDAVAYMANVFAVRRGALPESLRQFPDHPVAQASAQKLRDLVHDTDALLRAYRPQIAALADVLYEKQKLTESEVTSWRDQHFQQCSAAGK